MKTKFLLCAICPILLIACDSKPNEANNNEKSVERVDEPKPEAASSELTEASNEQSDPETPVSGAVIGAVAGEYMGHQSGTALEGAAIGAAAGGVIGQPAQPGAIEEVAPGGPAHPDEEEIEEEEK